MDTQHSWIVPLSEAADCRQRLIGGKAAKLAQLGRAGLPVPRGFCITTEAYERFTAETGLTDYVAMELGRKPLDGMRWEEIWDTALRIRSEFLRTEIPGELCEKIGGVLEEYIGHGAMAVRSSAPGEDSQRSSFAGLHESVVGVEGMDAVQDAVRRVWASLWSDAALLYRRELSLDPLRSRMAVLVQSVKIADCSGVAFGRDPRDREADCAIVEAVPGQCALLVDGAVDPDRWTLKRSNGEVVHWRPGERGEARREPLLDQSDLENLLATIIRVEDLFAWSADIEWTGRSAAMVVLQARPITTSRVEADDQRQWYLSLRPSARRLKELAERVTSELIPRLQAEGARFAVENLEQYDDQRLGAAIQERLESLRQWKKTYWDEFIPFAHGVRQLGQFYNDTVRPADPYEFVRLLKSEDMLAARRNRAMARLAARLRDNVSLHEDVVAAAKQVSASDGMNSHEPLEVLRNSPGGAVFLEELNGLTAEYMDITYGSERLLDRPDVILHTLIEMAAEPERGCDQDANPEGPELARLERRFFEIVGPDRREEAAEILRIGRVSWQLRDDDNLLLSRVESQLFRAVDKALDRLQAAGCLPRRPRKVTEDVVPEIAAALIDRSAEKLDLPEVAAAESDAQEHSREKPRQLIGQPASPGLATGKVRRVVAADDIKRFCAGEVLVCDAIQPMMTHLVPLAAAIVERRGGMLIHGAIIAREMQIPCVNGVAAAAEILEDGQIVTVDGHLGIVTVGLPEFDLELEVMRDGSN